MNAVFLILVHANSNQLRRLINRLRNENASIFIHVDLKIELAQFEEYLNFKNIIFIKKRVRVRWGAYSMVECMVNSFKEILPHFPQHQYVSVLSGQDYPLLPIEDMNQYLSLNQGKAFMEFYPVFTEWYEAIPRLEKYHLTNYTFPGNSLLENILNKVLPRRKPPKELTYVGRSQWFTITIEHIEYIVNFLESNSHIRRFFALTWGCDEIVFQSILYSSVYKNQLVNNNLRYIDWTEGSASPKILTINDAERLKNSGKFFARKFDINIDSQILDWIDDNLLTKIIP